MEPKERGKKRKKEKRCSYVCIVKYLGVLRDMITYAGLRMCLVPGSKNGM